VGLKGGSMLLESKCYERHCKHYLGISQPDGTEMTERHYCTAFPDRIPDEIAYGDNEHLKSEKDQGNDIVFEKGPFEWETEEGGAKLVDLKLRF
jgi:hypothetical protein